MFWAGLIGLLTTPWVFTGYEHVGHYYDVKGFVRPPWIQASICLMLLGLTGERHLGIRIFYNRVAVALVGVPPYTPRACPMMVSVAEH